MPLVSFDEETLHKLETFYKAEIGLNVKMQREKPLDVFIEEMAIIGLEQFRNNMKEN